MAKRKSMNKRLSRYSRQSAGSAVLDADTDILGEEYPYWWKNLENNTIPRLSVDSNVLNQTSRHLDSNSQIGTSQAADGWWNALEASNISHSPKINMDNAEKDVRDSSSKSESEDECRVAKRKFPFRSKVQRNKGNAFLNALNDSAVTSAIHRVSKTRTKGSTNSAEQSGSKVTNFEESEKGHENSSNVSQTANVLLKSRPDVFKRNYKDRTKNAFVDIVKGDRSENFPRKSSSKMPSDDDSPIVTDQAVLATTEVSSRSGPIQFALSFENEHDLSRYFVPKAQSTILSGSNLSVRDDDKGGNNSNTETEVLKPRSKWMTRHQRRSKKNLFENVFEMETADKKEGDTINQSATAVREVSEGSFEPSKASSKARVRSTANEMKYDLGEEIHRLSANEANEHAIVSAQNLRKSTRRNLLAETSIVSSDTSDVNREFRTVLKTKSKFLTGARDKPDKNLFQDILEGDDNIDTYVSRKSGTSLSREDGESMVVENAVSVEDKGKQDKSVKDANGRSNDLHTKLSATSNEVSVPTFTKENDKNGNKESRAYAAQDENDKSLRNSSISLKRSFLRDMHDVFGSEAVNDTSKSKSRNANSTERRSVSRSSHEKTAELERARSLDVSKRQRDRSGRSRNYSFLRTTSGSESEEAEATPTRSKRDTSGAPESPKAEKVLERQRGSRSRSDMRLNLSIVNELESEADETLPKRTDKILNRIDKRSVQPAVEEDEPVETRARDVSQGRSEPTSNARKYLTRRAVTEAELKDVESTPRRTRRSLRSARKRSAETESTQVRYTPKRQRDRSGESQKSTHLRITNDSKSEEGESKSKRSGKKSSVARVERSVSAAVEQDESAETAETRDVSKRRSDRSSNAQEYLSVHSVIDSIAENAESTQRRSTRSTNKTEERSAPPVSKGAESTQDRYTPRKERDRLGESQKSSHLLVTNDSEAKEGDGTTKRSGRNLSRSRVERSISPAVKQGEPMEIKDVPQRRSDRSGNEPTRLSPRSVIGSEAETVKSTPRRSSRNLSKVESTKARSIRKDQSDRRSKSQKSEEVESTPKRSRARVERSISHTVGQDEPVEKLDVPQKRNYAPLRTVTESESNINASKGQRSIVSFFRTDRATPASQVLSDKGKVDEIKRELERVKESEMARMKNYQQDRETKTSVTLPSRDKAKNGRGKSTKVNPQKQRPPKQVHKAFLVNGQVYKVPRLPRPQRWITDRLYSYLWKRMEPKYKLETRVVSEKFVHQLSNVTTFIVKSKSYIHYKAELYVLMKEMARIGIIRTRNDFYNFCHDFFPYELRIKTVPMLLPGNKRNIPYDPDKLHEPLLDSSSV